MPSAGHGDPLLKGKDWELVKAYWRRQRQPCARCGGPIDYDGPRGPRSLDVGHIVSRDQAKAMGWTREMTNAIANTRPEHQACGRSAGASYGNRKRSATRTRLAPIEADEW